MKEVLVDHKKPVFFLTGKGISSVRENEDRLLRVVFLLLTPKLSQRSP
ncbi:MAG: hypothetical protein M3R50_11005 [Bacteroidota bacterium]|nr:hypothetical protein [Bacteroidota bacterium]